MITDKTYSFVEKPDSDFYSIRINEGEFAGVVYTYGTVKLIETEDGARVSFIFKIDETPAPHTEKELNQSTDFKNLIGQILDHFVNNSLENGEGRIGERDTTGTDSPQSSNE